VGDGTVGRTGLISMDFRLLGPLEVADDGHSLVLGGVKQRLVLAILLLHANEVVSTDRLPTSPASRSCG
jgi:DNA-binding SARP family transcriptional activator